MPSPYWKYHCVECPLGSTEPVRVAPFELMPVAAPIRTMAGPVVANVWSPPVFVPAAFVATARTW